MLCNAQPVKGLEVRRQSGSRLDNNQPSQSGNLCKPSIYVVGRQYSSDRILPSRVSRVSIGRADADCTGLEVAIYCTVDGHVPEYPSQDAAAYMISGFLVF